MEKDLGINNKVDLYKRLLPALNCKVRELERVRIINIKKEDIWNYLIKEKWDNFSKMELSEMVDDILNLDNDVLSKCIKGIKDNSEIVNNEDDEIELL